MHFFKNNYHHEFSSNFFSFFFSFFFFNVLSQNCIAIAVKANRGVNEGAPGAGTWSEALSLSLYGESLSFPLFLLSPDPKTRYPLSPLLEEILFPLSPLPFYLSRSLYSAPRNNAITHCNIACTLAVDSILSMLSRVNALLEP